MTSNEFYGRSRKQASRVGPLPEELGLGPEGRQGRDELSFRQNFGLFNG